MIKSYSFFFIFLFLKKSTSDFTTDFAFLLDGNVLQPDTKNTSEKDILLELDNRTEKNMKPEDSNEDFFKIGKENVNIESLEPVTLKIDKIINDIAKKESAYQLAEKIKEIKRRFTSTQTTTIVTTTTTTKLTTTKPKTTKGPKTKWLWKKRKLRPFKRRTQSTTKKVVTKTMKKLPVSPDPARQSCGRMSPNQEKMLAENDVSDVMFFNSGKKNKKPQPKPRPKHVSKPTTKQKGQRRRRKKGHQKKVQKRTKINAVVVPHFSVTTKVATKTTFGEADPAPDWSNSFRRAGSQGRLTDQKKPVFENDTHILTIKQPVIKLDDSEAAYPFIVTLHSDLPKTERICVGSLIAATWVLTAARCTIPPKVVTRIRYGDMTLPPTESQFRKILKTFLHPTFDINIGRDDVCVLRVQNVAIEEKVGKLTAVDYKTMLGQAIKYTGFGLTTPLVKMYVEDQRKPLQIVEAQVVPCGMRNKSIVGPYFCASLKHWKRNQITLVGDAGAPAIHFGRIAGVCTGEPYPPIAVYTPVSPYLDWIRYTVLLNEI